eukprot:scaffold3716_cov69-Cylindrotheca_fusiformis.AAC.4
MESEPLMKKNPENVSSATQEQLFLLNKALKNHFYSRSLTTMTLWKNPFVSAKKGLQEPIRPIPGKLHWCHIFMLYNQKEMWMNSGTKKVKARAIRCIPQSPTLPRPPTRAAVAKCLAVQQCQSETIPSEANPATVSPRLDLEPKITSYNFSMSQYDLLHCISNR